MKECSQCTNIDTPLCNECTFIESAKGNSTPTKYCGYAPESALDVQLEDLSAIIECRVKKHRPIHLNYVIKYNKLVEAKHYGKKENISTS